MSFPSLPLVPTQMEELLPTNVRLSPKSFSHPASVADRCSGTTAGDSPEERAPLRRCHCCESVPPCTVLQGAAWGERVRTREVDEGGRAKEEAEAHRQYRQVHLHGGASACQPVGGGVCVWGGKGGGGGGLGQGHRQLFVASTSGSPAHRGPRFG